MRVFVTDHAVIGAAKMGQRERIRGGAVENQEDRAVDLKNLLDAFNRTTAPLIVSIGNRPVRVCLRQGRPGRGQIAAVLSLAKSKRSSGEAIGVSLTEFTRPSNRRPLGARKIP